MIQDMIITTNIIIIIQFIITSFSILVLLITNAIPMNDYDHAHHGRSGPDQTRPGIGLIVTDQSEQRLLAP